MSNPEGVRHRSRSWQAIRPDDFSSGRKGTSKFFFGVILSSSGTSLGTWYFLEFVENMFYNINSEREKAPQIECLCSKIN